MIKDSTLIIVLLTTSSGILLTLFIIILQQTCVTSAFDARRCHRLTSIMLLSFCIMILNILCWMAYIYPDYKVFIEMKLSDASILYEGILMIFAFRMYQVFELWVIDRIYAPMNMYAPKWMNHYFICRQMVITISAIWCYPLSIYGNSTQWMKPFNIIAWLYVFYIICGVIITIESILILWVLIQTVNILNNVGPVDNLVTKSGKRLMQCAIYLATIILLIGITIIFACTVVISFDIDYNEELINNVIRSVMIILFIGILVLCVYQPYTCCTIPDGSVCVVWSCCGQFCAFYCHCCCTISTELRKLTDGTVKKMLLEDSGATPITQYMYDKSARVKQRRIVITPLTIPSGNTQTLSMLTSASVNGSETNNAIT